MSCNCEPKKYSIGMGCCVPVLAPIENYYTKHQIDEMLEEIESGETSGCCITPEEVDEKIDAAISGINQDIETISGDLQAVSAEVESISGLTSGDVQTMIDESVSGKQDTLIAGDNITIVNNVISAVSGGSGISSAQVQTMIDESISGKTNQSDFSAHTANTDIHVTAEEKAWWTTQINALWEAISGTPVPPTPPTPYTEQYFTTEILGEVSPTTLINLVRPSGITTDIKYSLDSGATWTPYTTYITGFSTGDKVMWKGHVISQTEQSAYGSYGHFHIGTAYKVYGNVMSLLYDDNFADKTTLEYPHIFFGLFSGYEDTLTSIEGLVLPATTLSNYCYEDMFYNCASLTTVPTDLLPATTLAVDCYHNMFHSCTSLTNVPNLPATTLADHCYASMFGGCTSLRTAPTLPATTLADWCYSNMFSGCTSLNEITCYATNLGVNGSTANWVNGVAANGTFKTPSSTNWESGVHGIPSGWTRVDI